MAHPEGKKIMYAPLQHYLDFAKQFECPPENDQLFWEKDIALNDLSILRMRGLNSALVCDSQDDADPFKMVLGDVQCLSPRESGVTYLYLTHHPPQWLKDGDEVEDHFRNYAPVQLMGHKHRQRKGIIYHCLRIAAGAVIPDKREPDWTPRYNVIAVSVQGVSKGRKLKVDVYPRVWKTPDAKFVGEQNDRGTDDVESYLLDLPDWEAPSKSNLPFETAIIPEALGEEFATLAATVGAPKDIPPKEFPVNLHRRITYRFLSLPHRVRLEIAMKLNLIRDEDEATDDAELIRRIFRRARESEVLEQLVKEVDERYTATNR
jgi:hypothetical protein